MLNASFIPEKIQIESLSCRLEFQDATPADTEAVLFTRKQVRFSKNDKKLSKLKD